LFDARQFVHTKQNHRRPSNRCFTLDNGAVPGKMLIPDVGAGIEQANQLVGLGIIRRGIAPLGSVALRAAPTSVLERGFASVLPSPNMIDGVRQHGLRRRKPAVLASPRGPSGNRFAAEFFHGLTRVA